MDIIIIIVPAIDMLLLMNFHVQHGLYNRCYVCCMVAIAPATCHTVLLFVHASYNFFFLEK